MPANRLKTGNRMGVFRARRWVVAFLILLGVATSALFVPKLTIEFAAARAAERTIERLQSDDGAEQSFLLAATQFVHAAYIRTQQNPRPGLLTRLRPYLSNRLLPDAIRVEAGAIDMLEIEGLCDAAARTLAYLLKHRGFDAAQLNIIAPNGGHSVVEVRTAARTYMLDPQLGLVPMSDGRVLSPGEARDMAADYGIWKPLADTAIRRGFYRHFGKAVFARQGAGITFTAEVRLAPGEILKLGRLDGSARDVEDDGSANMLSPYWGYIGSRYDRSWRRGLRFSQDTTVEFTLTDDLDPRYLNLDRAPDIDGRTLTVRMRAGETLYLIDDRARRNFLTLRSYQKVDRVRFIAAR